MLGITVKWVEHIDRNVSLGNLPGKMYVYFTEDIFPGKLFHLILNFLQA